MGKQIVAISEVIGKTEVLKDTYPLENSAGATLAGAPPVETAQNEEAEAALQRKMDKSEELNDYKPSDHGSDNDVYEEIKDNHAIEDFLHQEGYDPMRRSKGIYAYCSPIRDGDSDPSFMVYTQKRYWKDFGTGKYGDIIDLVQLMFGMSLADSIEHLKGRNRAYIKNRKTAPGADQTSEVFQVVKIKPANASKKLVQYAASRGISKEVLMKYFKTVFFIINGKGQKGGNKPYFSLGIKNKLGCWELRNKIGDNELKGNIGRKYFTFLKGSANTRGLNVFEGSFDGMSAVEHYREMYGAEKRQLPNDTIILNSANQVKRLIEEIEKGLIDYDYINWYGDNNEAGEQWLTVLEGVHADVRNKSKKVFPNHEDYNEFWMDKCFPDVVRKPVRMRPDADKSVFRIWIVWTKSKYDQKKTHPYRLFSEDLPEERERLPTKGMTYEELLANYDNLKLLIKKVKWYFQTQKAIRAMVCLNQVTNGKDEYGNLQYGYPVEELVAPWYVKKQAELEALKQAEQST